MSDDRKASVSDESSEVEKSPPDRRELVTKLAKAAILPIVVATFLASDLTDAAASP
jgi:hypothetical protein